MKVLIACEFSGIVREAFRKRGHDAWSCDLLPTEISGNHIQDDVLNHLDDGWDLMIAHPPCTYLAVSGAAWYYHPDDRDLPLNERRPHPLYPNRKKDQKNAIEFFMEFVNANVPRIAIENPIGIMNKVYKKPDQIIQPHFFGDSCQKATCLWLKGLPKLVYYKEDSAFGENTIVDRGLIYVDPRGNSHDGIFTMRAKRAYSPLMLLPRSEKRWMIRSRTFQGIARAMAEQWDVIE